jgi:Fe-S cluster assembly protein SufD
MVNTDARQLDRGAGMNQPSAAGHQLPAASQRPHPYVAGLLAGFQPPQGELAWLRERRARALERANALAVPTTRDEEWRFTDITPLTRVSFRRAAGAPGLALDDIASFTAPEAAARLVFVDGVHAPALSAAAGLPRGIVVTNLAAALAEDGAGIEPHLARHLGLDNDVFAAINTSHLHDGAFVRIAKNTKLRGPVHLLFVSTQPQTVSYPRCLVVVESGAECTLIEQHAGLPGIVYFNNSATEVVVGQNARVQHVRLQQEAAGAFHIASCAVVLDRDARYASQAVTLGARVSRQDVRVLQRGEGVEVELDGLTLIDGRQLADTHTVMDHAVPNGKCRQLNKCIVGGAAHAVFNGKVVVRQGAQLSDSAQQSRNLLLSAKAQVDTKPQLEIFADDVKCAHGATVGRLDPEQEFYLRARGLSGEAARNLLTYAFGAEVIDRIPVPSLVERLEKTVMARTQTKEAE